MENVGVVVDHKLKHVNHVTLDKKTVNVLEFINRIIVYKTPEIITVAGILYLIKDNTKTYGRFL